MKYKMLIMVTLVTMCSAVSMRFFLSNNEIDSRILTIHGTKSSEELQGHIKQEHAHYKH